MLIRLADGRSAFLDFRERAPAMATRNMYLDTKGNVTDDSLVGWRASGVPGTVRGLELASKRYGHKDWADLLRPAIELARNGFSVSYSMMQSLRDPEYHIANFAESKRIFLKNGAYYDAGETFRQPDLARTLERIAAQGSKDFYEGETARLIAGAMAKNGGLITLDDLKKYEAVERKPLEGDYKGYHVVTAPPPSSGGIGLLEMLGMLDGTGYEKSGAGSAATYHYEAEAMRRYYADRAEYLGDPDFVDNHVSGLLDPAYLKARRGSIEVARATPSNQVNPGLPAGHEGANTTHFSIVDEQGNAVAVTYTLNEGYGSGVTIPGAGKAPVEERRRCHTCQRPLTGSSVHSSRFSGR
jgi:gamma-glutamyltranspeptidase/glutathione hydrolase